MIGTYRTLIRRCDDFVARNRISAKGVLLEENPTALEVTYSALKKSLSFRSQPNANYMLTALKRYIAFQEVACLFCFMLHSKTGSCQNGRIHSVCTVHSWHPCFRTIRIFPLQSRGKILISPMAMRWFWRTALGKIRYFLHIFSTIAGTILDSWIIALHRENESVLSWFKRPVPEAQTKFPGLQPLSGQLPPVQLHVPPDEAGFGRAQP